MNVKYNPPEGFTERIREELLNTKKEITTISRETGIARTSIYDIMYNSRCPNIMVVAKLSKYLGVSIDYLVFGE